MKAELNQRLTQVGPRTPGGELLRRYWQPVALLDEFDPALDPGHAPLLAVASARAKVASGRSW